jgi:hypothetical protein
MRKIISNSTEPHIKAVTKVFEARTKMAQLKMLPSRCVTKNMIRDPCCHHTGSCEIIVHIVNPKQPCCHHTSVIVVNTK